HLSHGPNSVAGEEHMLGSAESDTLRPEFARLLGILRRIRVGAHAEPADVVCPTEEARQVTADRGFDRRNLAQHDLAARTVEGYVVTLVDRRAVGLDLLLTVVDGQGRR